MSYEHVDKACLRTAEFLYNRRLEDEQEELNEKVVIALNSAVEKNDLETVKKLFNNKAVSMSNKYHSLCMAANLGFIEIAKFLVENGIKPFKKYQFFPGRKYSAFQVANTHKRQAIIDYFKSVYNK
jgi:ankyrin repeat protein